VSSRQKAQQGKSLIKEAIVELLESRGEAWLFRSEIEEALGIASTYNGSDDADSYQGGLAAMLLSELAQKEEGKIERQKTGKGWLYRISK
jgi:hypothetical protein